MEASSSGGGRLLSSRTPLFGYNTLGFPLGISTTQGNAVSVHGNQLSETSARPTFWSFESVQGWTHNSVGLRRPGEEAGASEAEVLPLL